MNLHLSPCSGQPPLLHNHARYDDLARLASGNCGSVWAQTFSYDAFGNLTKSGSEQFQPGYNVNNQMATGASYDAMGDVVNDGLHSYAWNSDTRPTTIDTVTVTYDAFGRMVEQTKSGTNTEIQYSPTGYKMQLMNGQTPLNAFVALPGGATMAFPASGPTYYRHADWLGSSRFASTYSTRTMYNDLAYAPFGETYAATGSTGVTDISFAGNNEDTTTNLYDAQFREYGIQGRWPSPDPAGLAAANPANPQSWNRYAYVLNNPLLSNDRTGLHEHPLYECGDDGFGCPTRGNAYGGGQSCTLNGGVSFCSVVESLIDSGSAVQCPDNLCEGVNGNGQPVYFWVSTNGSGSYYTYSGPGALYYSLEAAAIAALGYVWNTYGVTNNEYGGNIYRDANGVYSFTQPVAGPPCQGPSALGGCEFFEDPSAIPNDTELGGIYHTHPYGGSFSLEDTNVADTVGVPSFVGTPQGCIWEYPPNSLPPAILLQGTQAVCR